MSQDLQKLTTISYVTDCDTELYNNGEITGGFDEKILIHYFERHNKGLEKILCHLALLSHQAIETWRKIKSEESCGQSTK